ncbi:hypothetical protein ACFR99_11365 [Haloarchaeobius amylolyticus]|uniref:DUF8159 domain-containing protein n=1 Tax=Haloarchaeobius amylolyticus TaxID=1198296 RepID=A0ABD6BJ22_9EURY
MTDDGADAEHDPTAGERPVAVTLENRLMSHGIYLTSFAWKDEADPPEDGAGIELEYEVVAETPRITRDEVGAVLRTLLTIGDERSWMPGRLEVTSLTTDGDVRGWWYVEREWFEQLESELSQLEFSQQVLSTIKNYRPEYDSR